MSCFSYFFLPCSYSAVGSCCSLVSRAVSVSFVHMSAMAARKSRFHGAEPRRTKKGVQERSAPGHSDKRWHGELRYRCMHAEATVILCGDPKEMLERARYVLKQSHACRPSSTSYQAGEKDRKGWHACAQIIGRRGKRSHSQKQNGNRNRVPKVCKARFSVRDREKRGWDVVAASDPTRPRTEGLARVWTVF